MNKFSAFKGVTNDAIVCKEGAKAKIGKVRKD